MNKTSFWLASSPMLMFLVGCTVIVASLFFFLQPKTMQESHVEQLRQHGIIVTGKIVDVGRTMGGVNGDNENLHETVEVEYFVSGKTYFVDASRKIQSPGWEIGEASTVIYAPDNPADAFIDDSGVDESKNRQKVALSLFLCGSIPMIISFILLGRTRNKR